MNRIIGIIFITLGAGTGIFAGSELLLRVLQYPSVQYYRNLKLLHIYHPKYRVGLAAHADYYLKHAAGLWEGRFTTNSYGYRGSSEPAPGKPQLACLGDSIVMGFGVSDSETFCSQLNGIVLNGKTYQTQNLGVDAFGSRGAYERLKEAAQNLEQMEVVLFFISPNDFTLPPSLLEKGVSPDDVTEEIYYKNEGSWNFFRIQFELTRNSYTLMALRLALEQLVLKGHQLRASLETFAKEIQSPFAYIKDSLYRDPGNPACDHSKSEEQMENMGGANGELANCPEPLPESIQCMSKLRSSDLDPLNPFTMDAYDRMIRLARKKNFHLIPIIMPIQTEVLQCMQRGKNHPFYTYALQAKEFFHSRGIEVLSLAHYAQKMCGTKKSETTGQFQTYRIQDHFIPNDGHFTVEGNRLAAETIRASLKEWARKNAL